MRACNRHAPRWHNRKDRAFLPWPAATRMPAMPDIVPTHRLTEQASLKMLAAGVRKADELDCKVRPGSGGSEVRNIPAASPHCGLLNQSHTRSISGQCPSIPKFANADAAK